ncbi:hypothetical protein [Marinoscillum sp.]|uniref:hypothetical protein n=1 Tax=Marinoscillum sp. TaxID=2024838 RepID=UPI003BACFC39
MKIRPLFCVNGGTSIGFGHVSRTLSLINQYKRNNHVAFTLTLKSNVYSEKLKLKSDKLLQITSFNDPNGLQEAFNFISKNEINCIIVDLVESDFKQLSALRILLPDIFIVSITLFYFDEVIRFEDLSFFPSFNPIDFKVIRNDRKKLKVYSGKDYLVFSDKFKEYSSEDIVPTYDILITMGGTDPFGITVKAVKALQSSSYKVGIILSGKSEHFHQVQELIKGKSNFVLIEFSNDLPLLMRQSRVLLLNGGITRYEACLAKRPFIAISIHDLQYSITENLTNLGVGVNLGVHSNLETEAISQSVHELISMPNLYNEMVENMSNILDDFGSERIYHIIKREFNEKNN